MIEILSNNGEDEITDCSRAVNNGKSPITYGDIKKDSNGNVLPNEVTLTDKDDYLSQQSLDYIF